MDIVDGGLLLLNNPLRLIADFLSLVLLPLPPSSLAGSFFFLFFRVVASFFGVLLWEKMEGWMGR